MGVRGAGQLAKYHEVNILSRECFPRLKWAFFLSFSFFFGSTVQNIHRMIAEKHTFFQDLSLTRISLCNVCLWGSCKWRKPRLWERAKIRLTNSSPWTNGILYVLFTLKKCRISAFVGFNNLNWLSLNQPKTMIVHTLYE